MEQRLGRGWARPAFLLLGLLFPPSVGAIESICPGGASPRSDVKLCSGFESTTGCTTGKENACWTGNGFDSGSNSSAHGWTIKNVNNAPEGSRAVVGTCDPGSVGPGYAEITLPGSLASVVRTRAVLTFKNGRATYHDNHILGLTAINGDDSCHRGGTIELSSHAYYLYSTMTGGCGVGSFDLYPNQGTVPVLLNNKDNVIELLYKMDTSCSDTNSVHGCNGVFKMWINGTLVTSYTDVNWGGFTNGVQWKISTPVRAYNHRRCELWESQLQVDAIVFSDSDSVMIGAPENMPTSYGDTQSPYLVYCNLDAYWSDGGTSQNLNTDCAAGGCKDFSSWRTGTITYDAGRTKGGYTNSCGTSGYSDRSLKVSVTGADGAGHFYQREGGTGTGGDGNSNAYRVNEFKQICGHGFIYLDPANVYTDYVALPGFKAYTNTDNWGKYLALSVDHTTGKWAVLERSDASFTLHTTGTYATPDRFHEFEICLFKNDGTTEQYSLMIDGYRLFNRASTTYDASWLFGSQGGENGYVLGFLDYRGSGTLNAWLDNTNLGSYSFWSCDGWGSDSCPHGKGAKGKKAGSSGKGKR